MNQTSAADKSAQGVAKPAVPQDPDTAARATFTAKRALVHPSVPDAAAQRIAIYVAALPTTMAPAIATAGTFNDGGTMVPYVRRQHAPPRLLGTVLLIDDRERVPGAAPLFAAIAETLARRGWDTWTISLPDVAPPAALPHERGHAVLASAQGGAGDAKPATAEKADAVAKSAAGLSPGAGRRHWTAPASRALPGPDLAARWRTWQTAANQRVAALVKSAQPTDRSNPLPPLVIIGSGVAADLVAERTAASREGATAGAPGGDDQPGSADALILIDLVPPPPELAFSLDGSVAALQLPTLTLVWQQPDPVAPGVWLRVPRATHRDLSHAPPEQLARDVRGWLDRTFQLRNL